MDIEPYSLTLLEWLYVFAAGLGLATLLLGMALLVWSLRRRAPLDLAAASFLALAGAAGFAAVGLAASERTAVHFLALDIGDLFGNLVKALVLAAAVLAAFILTGGAFVLGLRERVRWRRAALLAGGGLILVGGILPGLLWAVDDLESRHSRGHMTRAVLEGVAFGLKDSFTLIAQAGLPESYEVRISGGGAKSPIWQGIIADVLAAPLVNINTTEGGAFGAAILASVAAGAFPDVSSACEAMIQTGGQVAVGADAEVYAERYAIYQSLYPTLKDTFAKL